MVFLSGQPIIGGYERDLFGIKAGHGTCYCYSGKCFCEKDEMEGELYDYYYLFIFIFYIFHQKLHKIRTCFPEVKISTISLDHLIQKVYTPCVFSVLSSWASVNDFTFCNSCEWVPQLSSVWKDISQKHYCWKGLKYAEAARKSNKKCAGPKGFFWSTVTILTEHKT